MDPKLVFIVGLSVLLVFMWYVVIFTNKISNLSEQDVTLEAGNSSHSHIPEYYDPFSFMKTGTLLDSFSVLEHYEFSA